MDHGGSTASGLHGCAFDVTQSLGLDFKLKQRETTKTILINMKSQILAMELVSQQ